jgi:cytochrome c oxidase cbb3-type subunit 4
MDIHQLHSLLTTVWVVWFFVLFTGIIFWVFRPARKEQFERARAIPLHDSE